MFARILGPLVDLGSMLRRDQHLSYGPCDLPIFGKALAGISSVQVPYEDAGSLAGLFEVVAQAMLVQGSTRSHLSLAVDQVSYFSV